MTDPCDGPINSTAWLVSKIFIWGHPVVKIAKKNSVRFGLVVKIAKIFGDTIQIQVEIW